MPDLLACHENFRRFQVACNHNCRSTVEQVSGATLTRTGIPSSGFNRVFILGKLESMSGISAAIHRLFVSNGTPWEIVTTESAENLAALMEEFKLSGDETLPGMVLDTIPESIPPPPKELEIHKVNDLNELRKFTRTGSEAFGAPKISLKHGDPDGWRIDPSPGRITLAIQTGDRLQLQSALLQERSQASSLWVPSPSTGAMASGKQWHGGRRLTAETRMVAPASFLQASEMGRPVYERMGTGPS